MREKYSCIFLVICLLFVYDAACLFAQDGLADGAGVIIIEDDFREAADEEGWDELYDDEHDEAYNEAESEQGRMEETAAPPAGVFGREKRLIKIIRVQGNEVVSSASILSKIRTKPGDEFLVNVLNEDLKRLYALGYFTDVVIDTQDYADGIMVTFIVKEKPLIFKIEFKGNKAVRTAHLVKLMKIKEGSLLDHAQLNEDLLEIKRFYEKKGFPSARVSYEAAVDGETGHTTLFIVVDEKARVRIKDISVEGNEAFPAKNILRMISTKKDTWLTSGFLREEEFEEDLKRIKDFYKNSGYLDVGVDHERRYDEDGRFLYIAIKIDEGKKYLVGEVSVRGNVIFPEEEIRNRVSMIRDTPFSHQGLRYDIFSIQQFYYHKGYMFAQIDAETIFNEATGKVDISYRIVENELAYVNKIKIQGNTKTKDVVIRRELRIYPGERFDGDKIRRSKERLYNLGYFEEVNFDTVPAAEEPEKQDLVVEVKEAKTGEFSFGAGYSSIDQVIGFVEILQKNFDWSNPPTFTGGGQRLRARAQLGTVRKDYEVGWLEPWIFNYPLAFGFDVYQRTRSRASSAGYGFDEMRRGFNLTLGKELDEYLRGDLIYKLEDVRITDVPAESSFDLKNEEGTNTLSTLKFILTHDTRDNIFNPTRGFVMRNSIENAGGFLGADKDFVKYIGSGSVFFTHFGRLLLELKLLGGIVTKYGGTDRVPIYERFYAGGGNSIRGYRERGIGPRDAFSGDPTGGEAVLLAGAEYTFPLYADVIKGAVFYDVGSVWEKMSDFGSGDFKSGTGLGVRVKTPIGPVKLDYGYPLNRVHDEERKGRIYFSISHGF